MATALDAAYHYQRALYRVMDKYNFRAKRNRGDPNDYEILFYLSDPEMHIVTGDARFAKRIAASSQAPRIHVI